MTIGDIVWAVIGAAWVLWLLATAVVRPLPGFLRVVRGFVGSWAGRAIALAAWAGAGWHLFCQRP
jgi:uncharacterized membrane protein YeaQ/YmgE (transglycosylase-associated protein family)